MNEGLARFLDALQRHGRAYDATERNPPPRFPHLEPETARLVAFLLRTALASRVLEVGTSNGYGTIWLASAVEPYGGCVVSLERDAAKQAEAAENLEAAGLRHVVDLKLGDATEIVRDLEGPFDAVLFDADRISAPAQLRLLEPKLEPKALLMADNALSHPEEIAEYLAIVDALPDSQHQIVPVGKGLSVALHFSSKR